MIVKSASVISMKKCTPCKPWNFRYQISIKVVLMKIKYRNTLHIIFIRPHKLSRESTIYLYIYILTMVLIFYCNDLFESFNVFQSICTSWSTVHNTLFCMYFFIVDNYPSAYPHKQKCLSACITLYYEQELNASLLRNT